MDNGFTFTKSISSENAKEEYHKMMDNVYRFISENYIITKNYDDRVSKKDFENAYHTWAASDNTIKEVERKNLAGRLAALGITFDIGSTDARRNIYVYRGIKEKESGFKAIDEADEWDYLPFS